MEVVLRLLRGEDLAPLSCELKVKSSSLAQWREDSLVAGKGGLKSRAPDERDRENRRAKSKVGDLTMQIELLDEKIERLEAGFPAASRRPK